MDPNIGSTAQTTNNTKIQKREREEERERETEREKNNKWTLKIFKFLKVLTPLKRTQIILEDQMEIRW